MQRAIGTLVCSIVVVLVSAVATSSRSTSRPMQSSYAEDRAAIEDLQARYMFALDFKDADTYANTFTEDGVLDYGPQVKGREAIKKMIGDMGKRAADTAAKDTSGMWPSVGRHNISNIVVKIDGDHATGRAYWFHYGNNTEKRTAALDAFGNYEDDMVKVGGKWYFTKRKIYNEQVKDWIYKGANPAW